MIGSNVAMSALFTRHPLLWRGPVTGLSGLLDNDGTRDRAPFSADSTMSDVNDGVAVFINASIFWASRLQASTYRDPTKRTLDNTLKHGEFVAITRSALNVK